MANKGDKYWASESDSGTVVDAVVKRIGSYRKTLDETGLALRILRSFNAYQGYGPNGDSESSRTTFAGQTGEILKITVNQYAAMANQTTVLITSNKPTVKALASNNDYASLAQCKFAEALNDYYDRELAVSDVEREAARNMVIFGESWVVLDWDNSQGEPTMIDESIGPDGKVSERVITNGDVRIYSLTPFDIGRDPLAQKVDDITWVAFRRRVSKWDLAAQYPDKADDIRAFSSTGEMFSGTADIEFDFFGNRTRQQSEDEDLVWMWEFRHIPTPALPNGRLIKFLNSKTVLFDTVETIEAHYEDVEVPVPPSIDRLTGMEISPASTRIESQLVEEQIEDHGYPYRDSLFAFSAAPERIPSTSLGHTAFFDLLSLQEGVDLSASIMMSAVNAGGLQNLYVPRGSNITVNKMSGALNVIEYDGDKKPEAQANLAIPQEVTQLADNMKTWMQSRVSLNDVVTGTPSAGMPAQGMALLRAESVEFHSGLQEAYERLVQRDRTGILKLLQIFANTERVALIAGKGNHWALREFKKQDISNFNRFVVEPVNPSLKTLAGKVSFAQPLLQGGMITPQQYLQLHTTGRLEPITDFAAANQARIERNKELLMQGVGLPPFKLAPDGNPALDQSGMPQFQDVPGLYVRPLISDTFWVDIPEYLSILATPEIREMNAVTQKVLQVVQYCMALWQQQPPAITAVMRGVAFPGGPGGAPPSVPPMGTVKNGGPQDPTTKVPTNMQPPQEAGGSDQGIKQAQPPKLKGGDEQLQNAAADDSVLRK